VTNAISFMTANYVACETRYAMHGWGHGDRATQERFRPLDTFADRFGGLLGDIRALGFHTVDVWGAHLGAEWATDEHVAAARDALVRHRVDVSTYATWLGPENVDRACQIALALGTTTIGAGFSGEPEAIVPVLRRHGVTLAIENHPERTPQEVLDKIAAGGGVFATTIDTGWWATQGYDPVRAIEELGVHTRHVHLKDVRAVGEPHDTCPWGDGIVDVHACVDALARLGYTGVLTIEHEPEDHDPSEECREMRARLESWLA
jgi:L-ribulose-5-phosphate 3-epimerase